MGFLFLYNQNCVYFFLVDDCSKSIVAPVCCDGHPGVASLNRATLAAFPISISNVYAHLSLQSKNQPKKGHAKRARRGKSIYKPAMQKTGVVLPPIHVQLIQLIYLITPHTHWFCRSIELLRLDLLGDGIASNGIR